MRHYPSTGLTEPRLALLVLQRYTIFLRILLFRSINFLFPHLLLDSLLQMYFCRSFIAYTHVWSAVIIELYITTDGIPSTFDVLEHMHAIDLFHLDNSIHTFGNGIGSINWWRRSSVKKLINNSHLHLSLHPHLMTVATMRTDGRLRVGGNICRP